VSVHSILDGFAEPFLREAPRISLHAASFEQLGLGRLEDGCSPVGKSSLPARRRRCWCVHLHLATTRLTSRLRTASRTRLGSAA
jgi:hypothetical protein